MKNLRTYFDLVEAELDFARLKDEGLRVFIANQHRASIMPHYSMTIGGIKIQIHENADLLIDWILSPQGQYLVEKTGYIPL